MLRVVLAAGLAVVAVSGAAAQNADGDLVGPNWLKKPSQNDLMQVWPADALVRGLSGRAVIGCEVTVRGTLANCQVVQEEPVGSNFGLAALALTPQFLMKPATLDGKPVAGGTVRIPISFVAREPISQSLATKVVSNVVWTKAPTYAEMAAEFPAKARKAGVGGAATLSCVFLTEGGVKDCEVLNESPRGMGFGRAAWSMSSRFVGPTKFDNGEPTKGAVVQIRFAFPLEMATTTTPVIGRPQWAATPTAEDLKGAIPETAVEAGVITARVMLSCDVIAEGRLDACSVVSETPAGHGFGASTLNLAKAFRLTIWTDDGLPSVGGKARIPVRYDVAPQPAAGSQP